LINDEVVCTSLVVPVIKTDIDCSKAPMGSIWLSGAKLEYVSAVGTIAQVT